MSDRQRFGKDTQDEVNRLRAYQQQKLLSIVGTGSHREEVFRAFLDASTEAIVLADKNLNLVAMNSVALRLMASGVTMADIMGKSILDVVPGVRESGRYEAYRRVVETGEPFVADDVAPHPGLGEMHLSVRAFRVHDGMGLIVSDMTERRKNEDLALRFEKLESLSMLAGGIAHDFNNLLSGIFGYMDLALHNAPAQSDEARFLTMAMRTIDRARGITQQLLTFAKGGAPHKKRESLFPMVEETVRFCLSGSNVACEFHVEDNLNACDFDRTQIGQVVENLVINAQQAMPTGGTLRVVATNMATVPVVLTDPAVETWVCLSFVDTGVGIPAKLLSRIFDPFFTTKQRGSGLGLATCHSIIRQHGGGIDVSSTPGEGTTFRVYLPAAAAVVTATGADDADFHKGSGTILLMDDQDVVLDAFSFMLAHFGYTVQRTADGNEAMAALLAALDRNTPFCAIILDLTVPGKTGGLEVIEKIRAIDDKIPVFVTSGYSNDPVMSAPARYGFTDHIAKPFTQAELAAVLNRHL